jgi:hypothetical protein
MAACLNALISLNKWITGEVTPWIDEERRYEPCYLVDALRDVADMTDEECVGIVNKFKELYQVIQELLENQFESSDVWQNRSSGGGEGKGGSGRGSRVRRTEGSTFDTSD